VAATSGRGKILLYFSR